MKPKLKIEWVDGKREPKCAPDPQYPNGVDLKSPLLVYCEIRVPYPAPRCGTFIITCMRCGARVAVSTAGRADDPRSVQVPCIGH